MRESIDSYGLEETMLPNCSYLQDELESRVRARTGYRIRNLAVELRPDGIVLRGLTSTYYAKQLAQHGIRDLLPHVYLENAITVEGAVSRAG
jgi:hypothetical protein